MNNNKIIYFDQNVPEYYVTGSRDFQLLARLLTLALNSSKVEADSLLYLNDAILINDRLLPLLQTKVGFWTNREFTNDELRFVCDVFDLLVRKKGSRKGIIGAIEVYLRTIGISTDFDILITNRIKDNSGKYSDIYTINIGINALQHDYTLLQEILKYIIPTGYYLSIYFYDKLEFIDRSLYYGDFVLVSTATNVGDSLINGSYYNSMTGEWKTVNTKLIQNNYSTSQESDSDPRKSALLDMFEHTAWTDQNGQNYYNQLRDALYPGIPSSADNNIRSINNTRIGK